MTAVLEAIDNMDVSEKVQTMDYIWSSLEAANVGYRPGFTQCIMDTIASAYLTSLFRFTIALKAIA